MSLTKSDLQAIRQVLKPNFDSIDKRFKNLEKKINKVDKKLDNMFDFLDKDLSTFKKKTAYHLGVSVADPS